MSNYSLMSAIWTWRSLPESDRRWLIDLIDGSCAGMTSPFVRKTRDAAVALLTTAVENEEIEDVESEALRRRPDQEPR